MMLLAVHMALQVRLAGAHVLSATIARSAPLTPESALLVLIIQALYLRLPVLVLLALQVTSVRPRPYLYLLALVNVHLGITALEVPRLLLRLALVATFVEPANIALKEAFQRHLVQLVLTIPIPVRKSAFPALLVSIVLKAFLRLFSAQLATTAKATLRLLMAHLAHKESTKTSQATGSALSASQATLALPLVCQLLLIQTNAMLDTTVSMVPARRHLSA